MKYIRNILDLNKAIKDEENLGFVPTMGKLHNGHISLISKSKKKCKKTLVSIFVNPKQFNNKKDYKTYPRNISKDLKMLKKFKVDYVFIPTVRQIYNKKEINTFKLIKSQKILCAKKRKGHFEGVLNVMDRFINLIAPKYVFMGEKDFQQFFLVKKFLDNKKKTKIILCKTIRDDKNVALSSRNYLLTKNDLHTSGIIANQLIKLKLKIDKDREKAKYLTLEVKKKIIKTFNIKIDYLETRNINNLKQDIYKKKYKLFIAYYINNIRLIDNFWLFFKENKH